MRKLILFLAYPVILLVIVLSLPKPCKEVVPQKPLRETFPDVRFDSVQFWSDPTTAREMRNEVRCDLYAVLFTSELDSIGELIYGEWVKDTFFYNQNDWVNDSFFIDEGVVRPFKHESGLIIYHDSIVTFNEDSKCKLYGHTTQ